MALIDDLRRQYKGYDDDEIIAGLKATKYADYSEDEIAAAIGYRPSLMRRAQRGLGSTANAAQIGVSGQEDVARLVAEDQRQQLPSTAEQQKMRDDIAPTQKEYADSEGWGAVLPAAKMAAQRLAQFATNPREFAGMMVENLPNSLPGLAGSVAGGVAGSAAGPVGSLVGSLAGGTAGGYLIEQGAALREQIIKEAHARGVDPKDAAALEPIVAEKYTEFLDKARLKGIGTAGTDAVLTRLTLGLAGAGEKAIAKEATALGASARAGTIGAEQGMAQLAGLQAKQAARNTLGAKAGRVAGVTGAEMVGEGASEAAGQALAYGEVDPLDVIDESLMGLGQGVAMGAASKTASKALGLSTTTPADAAVADADASLQAMQEIGDSQTVDEALGAFQRATAPTPQGAETIAARTAAARQALSDPLMRDALKAQYGDQAADEAMQKLMLANRPDAPLAMRQRALSDVEALIGGRAAGQPLPTGEVTEMLPVGEATELEQIPTPDTRELPIGEAADLAMQSRRFKSPAEISSQGLAEIAAETGIPTGEATELDAEQVEAAPERDYPAREPRGTLGTGVPLDPAGRNAVAQEIDRLRNTNTLAARAYVREYEAGRITDADVMARLVPPAPETVQDRIEAAARQDPTEQPQGLIAPAGARDVGRSNPLDVAGGTGAARLPEQPRPGGPGVGDRAPAAADDAPAARADGGNSPSAAPAGPDDALKQGDLKTGDGQPYGTKAGAVVRAKKEGGEVVAVPGGWVVRKPQEPAQPPVFDPQGAQPGTPEYEAAFAAWSDQRAESRAASDVAQRRSENQAAIDKKNAWRKRVRDWFLAAKDGDTITDTGTGIKYKVVVKKRATGQTIKSLVAVDESGQPLPDGRAATGIGMVDDRVDGLDDASLDQDTGSTTPETAGASLAASLGQLLETGEAATSPASTSETPAPTPLKDRVDAKRQPDSAALADVDAGIAELGDVFGKKAPGERADAMRQINAVNDEWRQLYIDGIAYFEGDPVTSLSASAPQELKDRYAAYKKRKEAARQAYAAAFGSSPDGKPVKAAAAAAPLYASRPVTNAQAIRDWAASQGFSTTLPAEDMHVTVAYSQTPMTGEGMRQAEPALIVSRGKRTVEPLGDGGAIVLKFSSQAMQDRWQQYRDAGASWDYDSYTPHITITYDGKGIDLAKVKPYTGPIELGAEKQEALNVDKADDYKEAGEVDVPRETQTPEPDAPRVYRSRKNAEKARDEAGNTKRLKKVKGGWILREATDKEQEAAQRNGQRLARRAAVDVENDSLLTALAKLGGIAMSERRDIIGVERNKNIGGKMLFTQNGKPLDLLADEDMRDLGYVPQDEVDKDGGTTWLRDAIAAEFMGTRKFYSEQGTEWIEEAQRQREDAMGDPFEDVLGDFTPEELDDVGYTRASPEVQAATEKLLAEAEAAGIDTETLRDDVARATQDGTENEYHAALQEAVRQAIASLGQGAESVDAGPAGPSDSDGGAAAGQEGAPQELKGDPAALPEGVRRQLGDAIAALNDIGAELIGVEAARGKGVTLHDALVERLPEIRAKRARLAEFRRHAERNGFDAEAVIAKLGGDLDIEPWVVNGRPTNPGLPADERLLLMPCCDGKLDAAAPAGELYQGVMWQTLRAHQPAGGMPNMLILSAKHGLIDPAAKIEPYNERMTPERAAQLRGDIAENLAALDSRLKGKTFNDVLIVGGSDYRTVMADAVAELMAKGIVRPGATVNNTAGMIGEQRQKLGEYLRAVPGGNPATAEAAPAVVAPTGAISDGNAMNRLGTVMRRAGWEIDYVDLDLTGDKPQATLRMQRSDGRMLWAKVDVQGRASFETFQREKSLGIDKKNPQARVAPQVDDVFLGRQRFSGARSMLRGMVNYLVDNTTGTASVEDMRAAWASVMATPAKFDAIEAPAAPTEAAPAAKPEQATAEPADEQAPEDDPEPTDAERVIELQARSGRTPLKDVEIELLRQVVDEQGAEGIAALERGATFADAGITFGEDGDMTTILRDGVRVGTFIGKRTRETVLKVLRGNQPGATAAVESAAPTATTPAERAQAAKTSEQDAIIQLRKRKSVLESLLECLG